MIILKWAIVFAMGIACGLQIATALRKDDKEQVNDGNSKRLIEAFHQSIGELNLIIHAYESANYYSSAENIKEAKNILEENFKKVLQ